MQILGGVLILVGIGFVRSEKAHPEPLSRRQVVRMGGASTFGAELGLKRPGQVLALGEVARDARRIWACLCRNGPVHWVPASHPSI